MENGNVNKATKKMISSSLEKVPQEDLRECISKHVRFKFNLDEKEKGFILSINCSPEDFEKIRAKYPFIYSIDLLYDVVARILQKPLNEFYDYMNKLSKKLLNQLEKNK